MSALVLIAVVGATVAAYTLAVRDLHQDTRQSMSDLATSWSVALDSLAESADAEFTAVASAISGGHTERFDEGLASVPGNGGVGDIESAVLLTRRGGRYEVVRSARSEPQLLPPLRAPLAGPLGRVDEREGSVALESRTANRSLRIGGASPTRPS